MLTQKIRKLVPASVKQRIKRAQHSYAMTRAMAKLRPGVEPSDDLLRRLVWAWGNEGFSGDVSYLRGVCRESARTEGPILECGSGLTTLLLAIYAGKRGVSVVSLEHMPEWQQSVSAALERFGLAGHVVEAPLKSYDGFDWYNLPENLPRNLKLVICDGPPGETVGGRYGLLPVCRGFMANGCTILLDDIVRPQEQQIMHSWVERFGVTSEADQLSNSRYARLTYQCS